MMKNLLTRYPQLSCCEADIRTACELLIASFEKGGKLLLCGNGGSAADAEHISGELLKGFLSKRPLPAPEKEQLLQKDASLLASLIDSIQGGLPAIPLPSLTALSTAFSNDVEPRYTFAQEVWALGAPGDVLWCLSTSGNAENTAAAAKLAAAKGLKVISMTGKSGGLLRSLSDVCICVPESETYKVQELHLPVYHYICAAVEAHFFA